MDGNQRYSWTKKKRSPLVSRTLPRLFRCNTISCCRSVAISASSRAFDLNGETKIARTNQRSLITRSNYAIRSPSQREIFGTASVPRAPQQWLHHEFHSIAANGIMYLHADLVRWHCPSMAPSRARVDADASQRHAWGDCRPKLADHEAHTSIGFKDRCRGIPTTLGHFSHLSGRILIDLLIRRRASPPSPSSSASLLILDRNPSMTL